MTIQNPSSRIQALRALAESGALDGQDGLDRIAALQAQANDEGRAQRILDGFDETPKKSTRKAAKKISPLAMSDEAFSKEVLPINQAAVRVAEPVVTQADMVPAVVPVPVDRSIAGLMKAGNTGMAYPPASSWIPQWMRNIFTPSAPSKTEWVDMNQYRG